MDILEKLNAALNTKYNYADLSETFCAPIPAGVTPKDFVDQVGEDAIFCDEMIMTSVEPDNKDLFDQLSEDDIKDLRNRYMLAVANIEKDYFVYESNLSDMIAEYRGAGPVEEEPKED